jgi:hypothetical protein
MLRRTRTLVAAGQGAAVLAGLGAVGALVYMSGGASATNTEASPRGEARPADRTPAIVDRRESESSSIRSARTATTTESITTARSEPRASSNTSTPLVFRAKLVLTADGQRREEDARLSFAREQLSVTANHTPDDPVVSIPYGNITAIGHARRPAWKPPPKWSRVIKIDDDVLETIGIRDRHEISLHTDSDSVLFRVDDEIVNRVLRTLKERTGLSPALASGR